MIYQLVTIICLAILVAEVLYVLVQIVTKNRAERISFLRSFKKGKCAVIYVTAIPLYCIANIYNGQDLLRGFFNAVNKIINLVVLKYELGSVDALMYEYPLFNFTIYFTFVLVGANALLFTFSLIGQYIWRFVQGAKMFLTRKSKLFLFGNNNDNISIYLSDKTRRKVLIDNISDKDGEDLYIKQIAYSSATSFDAALVKIFKKDVKRNCTFIINTGSDETNIAVCRATIDQIRKAKPEKQKQIFDKYKIFVFGDPRYETIYNDIISSGKGCMHYVNKYQKIAVDFIDRYPFTKFMDEKQIDYSTSMVRPNVDINVLLIGFGKTNQQIFLTSVANNQFLTLGQQGPELKQVNYYIFDKNEAENNKNLNHNYYRYENECLRLNPDEYLPLPSLPANLTYSHLDINASDFYRQIRNVTAKNENDINFAIIAFGSDLENIDMAQKLVEKRKEWALDNFVIFVKARAWHKEQTLLEDDGCYFIANEKDIVYNLDKITSDKMFSMAKMRNEVYDLEYAIAHNDEGVEINEEFIEKKRKESIIGWYDGKSQMERESSMYCCLSLRSKLNLMNLDYCEASENPEFAALSEDEYLAIYAGDDLPDRSKFAHMENIKPITSYTLDFADSRRTNMAIHEHQRWNSFMISKGIVPSSKDQILNEMVEKKGKMCHSNGKNYSVRRHGNLTTFEGLVEFRKMVAERDGISEEETDVIKYDYQLLDDAYWFLATNGYKIIHNKKMF